MTEPEDAADGEGAAQDVFACAIATLILVTGYLMTQAGAKMNESQAQGLDAKVAPGWSISYSLAGGVAPVDAYRTRGDATLWVQGDRALVQVAGKASTAEALLLLHGGGTVSTIECATEAECDMRLADLKTRHGLNIYTHPGPNPFEWISHFPQGESTQRFWMRCQPGGLCDYLDESLELAEKITRAEGIARITALFDPAAASAPELKDLRIEGPLGLIEPEYGAITAASSICISLGLNSARIADCSP